jgi:hypothetical protein
VIATKYDGDEENSNKATAAHNSGKDPDRNLFLPEDPIADNAAEKKRRDADRDHDLSSADRLRSATPVARASRLFLVRRRPGEGG